MVYIFAGLSIILGFIDAVSQETWGRRRRKRRHTSDAGQDDKDESGGLTPVPYSSYRLLAGGFLSRFS
jgi:hypothetical protein